MWVRLQLYEDHHDSILGLVVGEHGQIFFRATDVAVLLGYQTHPWKYLDKLMPKSRPVLHVLPRGIPISYPNMKVVTYEEMIETVEKFKSSRPTKYSNLLERLVQVFLRARVVPVGGNEMPLYSTNPTRASTFAISFDERNEMDLRTLLDHCRSKFIHMYGRFRVVAPPETVIPEPRREIVLPDEREIDMRDEREIHDDDDEPRLVVDENPDNLESTRDANVMKICLESKPPHVIEWFDGKGTYTFRCMNFCIGRGDTKFSLHRNENVLENQMVSERNV